MTELAQGILPNFRKIYETANQEREEARRLTRAQMEGSALRATKAVSSCSEAAIS